MLRQNWRPPRLTAASGLASRGVGRTTACLGPAKWSAGLERSVARRPVGGFVAGLGSLELSHAARLSVLDPGFVQQRLWERSALFRCT